MSTKTRGYIAQATALILIAAGVTIIACIDPLRNLRLFSFLWFILVTLH